MILSNLIFMFKNRKLFLSKKGFGMEVIVIALIIFIFAVVVLYFILKNNSQSINMAEEISGFQNLDYVGKT